MDLRKNQANLTTAEKKAFVNAVLALKKKPSRLDNKTASRYDDYVQMHYDSMMAMDPANQTLRLGTFGTCISAMASIYIRQFELDLQAIDPSVTLPYWDWTVDNSPTSSIWSPDFMGGNGRPSDGRVMDGPFAFDGKYKWKADKLEPAGMSGKKVIAESHDLKRRLGTYPIISTLPTASQVADALAVVPYYVAPWRAFVDLSKTSGPVQPSFSNYLEGGYGGENGESRLHNRVHDWVGGEWPIGQDKFDVGTMERSTSPNDPVFFLHHCNIDRLWALWQQLHPTESYLPVTGGQYGHNLTDPMMPWSKSNTSVTSSSVLTHWALGYRYDTDLPHIELITPSLEFKDIQPGTSGKGITVYKAITFKVQSYTPSTLQIVSDLPAGFGQQKDTKSITVFPNICNRSSNAYLWVSYTSAEAGSKTIGSVIIKAVETGQKWTVNLSANTAFKSQVAMAVEIELPPPRIIKFHTPESQAKFEARFKTKNITSSTG